MIRLLIAGSLALGAAGQAFAADLPPAAPPPPRAPAAYIPYTSPVYNWGGIYVGLNAGGAYVSQGAPANTIATTINPLFPAGTVIPSTSTSSTGFAGGGQIGANFQASQFVFGIEADADYLSNKSTVTGAEINDATGAATSNQHVYTLDIFSTVRGRVGYAVDRALFYGTGGLAMGEYQVQRTQLTGVAGTATPGTLETFSTLRLGWTAGAGLEYAFTDNLTARVEYLFAGLEKLNYTFTVSNRATADPNEYVNIVRLGFNYKFGGF
jgi:outer membrane immunogenic protein